MHEPVRIRLLGPVGAARGDDEVALRGESARTVLAALALSPGDVVSDDRLVEVLWGDHPPERAIANIHTTISRLRSGLGHDAIERAGHGYRLVADRVVTDLSRVESALTHGHDIDDDRVVEVLDGAIEAWTGEPLSGVTGTTALEAERTRLRRLRTNVVDMRAAALLSAGRAAEAVPDLEREAQQRPDDEPVNLQLVRALSQIGDNARALRVAARFRRTLAEQSGLDPSDAFVDAEQAVLASIPTSEPPAGPLEPLGHRFADSVVSRLVGRSRELEQLQRAVAANSGIAVSYVHGAPGVGKSMLVAAATADLPHHVIWVDARETEPTPDGFLQAVARQLDAHADTDAIAERIMARGHVVLIVEAFEHFHLVDAWLRHDFFGRMPTTLTTILEARHPPSATWRHAPGWHDAFDELEVPVLDAEAVDAFLAPYGLDDDHARWAKQIAHGIPLVLELAANAPAPGLPDQTSDAARLVFDQISDMILGDHDEEFLRALQCAAIVRRVTEPLLAALDGENADPRAAWRSLRSSPVTTTTSTGLVLHDLVREVVLRDLDMRAPGRAAALRRTAAEHLLGAASGPMTWSDTADLLFMISHPSVRYGFFPPDGMDHPVEPATDADRRAIERIARSHLGRDEADLVSGWIEHQPEHAVVSRDDAGVDGFSFRLPVDEITDEIARLDPVIEALRRDLDARPMLPSAQAMLVRWTIADATGEDSGPAVAPLWIELKRFYLALRSSLQRVYGTTADWEAVRPVLAPLGFRPVTTPVRVGDELRVLMVIDFPPGGIDAWLASIVDLETAVSDSTEVDPAHTSDTATLDVAARFGLSPRELEVLGLVADGLTNHEIAARLYISERTVNRHVTTVFTKLGVNNRVAAARIAVQPDWTPPPNRQLS